MPKTFHMNVAFDVRIVLTDEDCTEAEKYREKSLQGTQGKQAKALAVATQGLPLDAYIAMTLKHALRDTIAEMADEEDLMSISPAKVTQVVIPRIETHHKAHALAKLQAVSEECTGEGTCKCQSDVCEFI